MKLADLLRDECIRVGSGVDDKAMALCEIAALAKQSPVLKKVSEEEILEALQEREITRTTAFGHGIAVPHCRMKGVRDFVVGCLTVPDGVEFDAEDGKKVQLIVFIIAPKQENNAHIRLLSAISQALQDSVVVEKMIFAESQETLRELFLNAARQDVQEQLPQSRDQVQIFVQDEGAFRDIVKSLSGLENISLALTAGHHGDSHGAGVQSGNHQCRIITLVVERNLRNEVVRRVETITGSLLECSGVLVTIQELAYSSGSLEM